MNSSEPSDLPRAGVLATESAGAGELAGLDPGRGLAVPSSHPRYSLVVPIYGDGTLAADFAHSVELAFEELRADRWPTVPLATLLELIFIDDGSPNDSHDRLLEVANSFPWVRVVKLSRNFGHHAALTCGYRRARGQFVVMLNVDQEDPPGEIAHLLDIAEEGTADLVIGVRTGRPWSVQRVTSVGFTWFLNWLTGSKSRPDAATLRVMSRRFVDAFLQLQESNRYFPGLEQWIGFRHAYVPIRQQARVRGHSSYNLRRRLSMAGRAVISFSDRPLHWVAGSGLLLSALGMVLVVLIVVLKVGGFVDFQAGFPTVVALILSLSGVQIGAIGLASLYIGRVLTEVQRRPLYVIEEDSAPDGFVNRTATGQPARDA